MTKITTKEKSIRKQYSIESLKKKISKNTLNLNYLLQREAGRWSLIDKSNEVADIANGYPMGELIFAERVNPDNTATLYILDGKQRLTNMIDYILDGYKISEKVVKPTVDYVDEAGKLETCDLRGKKFSQLPEQVQDNILDYSMQVTQYINCTSDELEYHMMRYNRGVKLNKSEKSIVSLGEEKAAMLRDVKAGSFFNGDYDNFKKSEYGNGTVLRVIAECVMIVNFYDNWKVKTDELCNFLGENAEEKHFSVISEYAEILDEIVSDDTRMLFNSKNCFLFFKAFDYFKGLGLKDEAFEEFLKYFISVKDTKKIDDMTWEDLMLDRHNRGLSPVKARVHYLCELIKEFAGDDVDRVVENTDDTEEIVVSEVIDTPVETVVTETVRSCVPVSQKYIDEFKEFEFVNDFIEERDVDFVASSTVSLLNSEITDEEYDNALLDATCFDDWLQMVDIPSVYGTLTPENIPVFINFVSYVENSDVDEKDAIKWFETFLKKYVEVMFNDNMLRNFNVMVNEFDKASAIGFAA